MRSPSPTPFTASPTQYAASLPPEAPSPADSRVHLLEPEAGPSRTPASHLPGRNASARAKLNKRLREAAHQGNLPGVKNLLARGADPLAKEHGHDAFYALADARAPKSPEEIETEAQIFDAMAEHHDAAASRSKHSGKSVLHVAQQHSHKDLVGKLEREYPALKTILDKKGRLASKIAEQKEEAAERQEASMRSAGFATPRPAPAPPAQPDPTTEMTWD